jgi:translation initiation factor IF-2
MRLAQIARKVDRKPTEIRSFISTKFNVDLDSDPNIKLEDEHVNAILEEFKVEEVVEESVVKAKEEVEEIEIDPTIETDVDALKEVAENTETEPLLVKSDDIAVKTKEEDSEIFPKADDVKTNTKDLAEKAEKEVVEINYNETEDESKPQDEDPASFDEVEVDREAALIAAKVEKLEGLKVVGKIDLGTDEPEPEEEELPTIDAIENEIDQLDGDTDTSEFTELGAGEDLSDEKAAIFAELDAQMESSGTEEVKQVTNDVVEVAENIEEEEYSIYKNKRGEYRFTAEQKANRKKSLQVRAEKERIERVKRKKEEYYKQNVAVKVQPPKKKKTSKPKKEKQVKKEEPKGFWQKFLNWLND